MNHGTSFLGINTTAPEYEHVAVKGGRMGGYTGNYIRLEKPWDPALVNQLETVTL